MDFYDDYSPYMEIDLMKMEDGYPIQTRVKNAHIFIAVQFVKRGNNFY